ncbi:MAG: hypothetical protein JWQ63_2256 [Mucilaginibacter sp.]|jgi:hypothetical protein|nr:hypothetical protein [Mucilaginibacter sp.]
MNHQTINDPAVLLTEQVIKQVINAWISQNKAVTTFFNKYEDDIYLQEVAPGRNRAIYILGHLISASDGMLPLFGIGERLFPQLEELFSKNPDKFFAEIPFLEDLKENWETINIALTAHFNKMHPDEWLGRHTKVSEEDFAIDPMRNKLNVLISRTNHLSYHIGQLNFLTERE